MSKEKSEIIDKLLDIYNGFEPDEENEEVTLFYVISKYNSLYDNKEKIGGSWVQENCPSPLKDLII